MVLGGVWVGTDPRFWGLGAGGCTTQDDPGFWGVGWVGWGRSWCWWTGGGVVGLGLVLVGVLVIRSIMY